MSIAALALWDRGLHPEAEAVAVRAEQIEASVGADERIEAEARAKVWEDRYPVGKVKAAGD